MIVTVEPVPYSGIVLHALKYPSKGVFGLLLGVKDAKGFKITSVVPITHETYPLAPVLELGLTLTNSKNSKIVGAYFANPNYQDKGLSPYATRLAEKIGSVNGSTPLLIQVINWQLNPDCPANCLAAYSKEADSWKETQLTPESTCLRTLARAIEQKIHRNIADLDNHLDRAECDFFNTEVNAQLRELSS